MSNAAYAEEPASEEPGDSAPTESKTIRARPIPRINIQAFCEDRETAESIQKASSDRRLARAHVNVRMGGIDAAVTFFRDASTPNLIIIESLRNGQALLEELDRLADVCDQGTKVIAIGHVNDVLLYRELLRRGVNEYIVAPTDVQDIIESISDIYTNPETGPIGQVAAFIGAKGGCGSSTVCHNTAFAIADHLDNEVVIADMDLPFGTAGLDFNQDPMQGIADALAAPERLDEVLLDRLLSRCSDHLSLFAAPGTLENPFEVSTQSCETVLDVVRANVPWVCVDLPHLWTDWAQQVIVRADHIVLTAVPDLANLRNAKNIVDQLKSKRENDRPPFLALNAVGMPKRPEISVKDFAQALELDPAVVIDFDAPLFGTAANNGQMIEEISAKSKAAEQFRSLAYLLADHHEQKAESGSLLAPLLSKLRLSKTSE
ncbi:CtpF protein [Methyloligella sp. 2.7D]|uniref:AAA family ATPase n=1 Tax=unclassified Methyloligella TaxID=2625955 RepID=UPI00157CA6FE|nr:CtpF protein [Methyloligella sp. GL2]QKP78585.1 CtpF protein [Methyloligella sp. GL2]